MGLHSYLIICALLSFSFFGSEKMPAFLGDEICNNAIDDDFDGLIDLNDPDCECPVVTPVSLIPNPSFEDMICCPQNRSQLVCADTWIQASEPTTDYLHTCGWMGWDDLPPPTPFPDGEGCVGFRNGRPGGGNGNGPRPNWKEYAGACLTGPLEAGVTYRFEFNIGFTQQPNSPQTEIVFFGSTDCDFLPFGIGDEEFGCPTNGPGWMKLGAVPIFGTNEWKLEEITVTPTQDVHAIAIGPNCSPSHVSFSTYYFFDNLVLASLEDFGFRITANAHPCSEEIDFSVAYLDTLQYQWYYNGVALIGDTSHVLENPTEVGLYQLMLIGPNSCLITEGFNHSQPIYSSFAEATICHGESYNFNGQIITEEGFYLDTLKNINNCDSVIYFDLDILDEMVDTVDYLIFDGDHLEMGNKNFSEAGDHVLALNSIEGCDSLVLLQLDVARVFIPNAFSPNDDGINDVFIVFSNFNSVVLKSVQVFDRWGGLVYTENNIHPNNLGQGWNGKIKGEPAGVGNYVYRVVAVLENGIEKEWIGSVVLMK